MARSVPWQRTCSDLVFWRQTEAQNATIYILRETGPTGFLLKEEGVTKPCKAFLGDPHSCTCTQFAKDRDLCKHICWLLLKKFRVPQTNPMSWQKGLVEREINEILRGLTQQMRKKVPTAVTRWRRPLSADGEGRETIPQRDIAEDDVCPICQDELLAKRLPVTYCKFGCGNSIHIKCMKIWAEHQKSQGETTVKCPFCREDFGPFELLKYENHNAEGPVQGGRMDRHIGITCQSCHVYPIEGKCYRCSSCADFYLCQSCFNTPIHTQHAFQYRHKRNQRWRAAGRAYGAVLPQAIVDDLVNRDITDNDYDLLMQLDSNNTNQGSDIPEEVIQSFPLEKIREHGPLLQPGMQCRVCLRGYQLGQLVRKLPRCKHKFHKDCIDNWLLHSQNTCPIDGQAVWDRVTAQLAGEDPAYRNRKTNKRQGTGNQTVQQPNTVSLEIPGVGLTIRPQEQDQGHRTQGQVRGRPPAGRSNREEREAQRIMGSLRNNNFSLSGTSIGACVEMNGYHGDSANVSVPGNRLLHRANHRQAALTQQLSNQETGIEYQPQQLLQGPQLAELGIHVEQENIDPLDQVAVANADIGELALQESYTPENRTQPAQTQNNHSAVFGQMNSTNRPDITNTLLSNLNRLEHYEDVPNVFTESANTNSSQPNAAQMTLDSVRTNQTQSSAVDTTPSRPSNEELHRRVFNDVPADQRLFSSSGSNMVESQNSHLLFNTSNPSTENRGHNFHTTANRGRKQKPTNSAPASVNGERGRAPQRRWSQDKSALRSNSRERPQRDPSTDRYMGQVPKEGEHLLERLQMFSDLYLGNSPHSNPAQTGMTATGLPPRPQRRQYGNQAAARLRRFENQRRKNNFSLEGNACSDFTLRDLLNS